MDKEYLFQFMRVRFREAGFTPDEIELHITNFKERYKNKSDDQIEADLMRRGGPSKVVANVIEQRNSVLMKDAEYRAFVESYRPEAAETPTEEDDDVKTYVPGKEAKEAAEQASVASDTISPAEEGEAALRAWFSDDAASAQQGEDAEEASIPALFRENAKKRGEAVQAAAGMDGTASVDTQDKEETASADNAAPISDIHTIPLFDTEAMTSKQSSSQMPAPPSGAESDMSRTKVIHVPTTEQRTIPQPPQGREQQPPAFVPEPQHVRDTVPHRTVAHRTVRAEAPARAQQKYKNRGTRGNVSHLSEMTYWGEGSEEGVRRFRIIFAVSIPFVILFLLLLAVLSAGVVLGIVALMIVSIAALVVEVAAGSVLSLVGIIYGISQIFLTLPIGMFELGLGIAVVGVTMLVGILLYNLAVRFLPFVLRQYHRFLKFFRKFLQDLYYYVKGECYRR